MSTKFDRLDVKGHEVLDSTPLAMPTGFKRPPTIQEMIHTYVRSASLQAEMSGMETFEEADDFDCSEDGDDGDPSTPYERDFDLSLVSASRHGVVQEPQADPKMMAKFKAWLASGKAKKDADVGSSGESQLTQAAPNESIKAKEMA